MAGRSAELAGEGFVRKVTIPAALAHWVLTVELLFEQDRRLRLVDETVLRLVGAGVSDPDQIADLMGLNESEIVPSSIANLMRLGAVVHDGGIRMTEGGGTALARSSLRQPRREEMQLHLDAHRDTVVVTGGRVSLLSGTEMRSRGLHQLPLPPQPTQRDLATKHLLVQASLEARLKEAGGASAIDLLKMVPADTPQALFEEVDIEVWRREADDAWRWRVLVDGMDDDAVTRSLRALEDEGGDVIPSVPNRGEESVGDLDRELTQIFDAARPAQEQARFEAIGTGGDVTLVLPAFPFALADLALLHRLEEEEGRAIRVAVAVPPSAPGGRPPADPLHELFGLLRRSGVSTTECRGPARHGLLTCGQRAFVTRYAIDAIATRQGRGVPHVEAREVVDAALSAVQAVVARIHDAAAANRERTSGPRRGRNER